MSNASSAPQHSTDLPNGWEQRIQHALTASFAPVVIEVIGEEHAFFGCKFAEWKAGLCFGEC
jgi:hypothetical protein